MRVLASVSNRSPRWRRAPQLVVLMATPMAAHSLHREPRGAPRGAALAHVEASGSLLRGDPRPAFPAARRERSQHAPDAGLRQLVVDLLRVDLRFAYAAKRAAALAEGGEAS